MINDPKKIVLVDAMAFIFRNFHATFKQGLKNKEDFPTGAIYGTINSMDNLLKRFPDRKIIIVSDHPSKNFRHELYPEYKANRKPSPEDLKLQIDPIYEILQAKGFPLIRVAGVEADDTIATIARNASERGIDTVIASGDKDLMQLINHNTKMLDSKWKIIDENGVLEKMGVVPEKISQLLAIIGDAADNIPGLKKAGPKTATKWLDEFGDLDGIKKNADKVGGKIGDTLRAGFDEIDLSYSLVLLKYDVVLPIDPFSFKQEVSDEGIEAFYNKYELDSLLPAMTHTNND